MKKLKTTVVTLLATLIANWAMAQNTVTTLYTPFSGSILQIRMSATVYDQQGNLWVGGIVSGIAKYDKGNSTWTIFDTLNSNIASNKIQCLTTASNGLLLIGTADKGLVVYDGSTFTNYNMASNGIASNSIKSIAEANGTIWLATDNGITKIELGAVTNYQTSNSPIISNYIRDITLQGTDILWIATDKGISRFNFNTSQWNSYATNRSLFRIINHNDSIFAKTDKHLLIYHANDFLPYQHTPLAQAIDILEFSNVYTQGNYLFAIDILSGVHEFVKNQFAPTGLPISKISISLISNFAVNPAFTELAILGGVSISNADTIYFVDMQNYVSPTISIPPMCIDCIGNNQVKLLDINKSNAPVGNLGDLHNSRAYYNLAYEVPKHMGVGAVYASQIMFGGLDASQNIHLGAQTYHQVGVEFAPGPLRLSDGGTDTATAAQYNKIWNVFADTIDTFKAQYALGNVQNGSYAIPEEIATWPAHGPVGYTQDLAPFVDVDGNGIYDPMMGDYPSIRGDECMYFIFNDNLFPHMASGGSLPIGIEVHAMVYSFECMTQGDDSSIGNYTTFYHYDMLNRSSNNYTQFYTAMWSDMDLGHYQDDYVGCDTILNIGYTMNGDNDDDNAYGQYPPIANCAVLKGNTPTLNDGIDNNHDGTIDESGEVCMMNTFIYYNNINNVNNGNPATTTDYYNYFRAHWQNGDPITYGSDGTNLNNPPTNFVFSGDPDLLQGWTELGNQHPPGDRRFMLSSGPFDFDANSVNSIDFAFIYTRDNNDLIYKPVTKNKIEVSKVKYWFANQNLSICDPQVSLGAHEIYQPSSVFNFAVYPNPATDVLLIASDMKTNGKHYEITDATGRICMSGNLVSNRISIAGLNTGIYIIAIGNDTQKQVKRFAKQ